MRHTPVLLDEVLDLLNCVPGKSFVDCTVGTGGHAESILEKTGEEGRVIGIDCDEVAIRIVKERLRRFGSRFIPVHDNFVNVESILHELGIEFVDGILLDLGVSSHQLDDPARGFSFKNDGPLDMRMDRSSGETADLLINQLPEKKLAGMLREFGEERYARRIAGRVIKLRKRKSIRTTKELATLACGVYRSRSRIHPATRTFLAVRIAVNKELDLLCRVLERAVCLLGPGGRICVISYHSLEDRIVKNEFRRLSKDSFAVPHPYPLPPLGRGGDRARLSIITRKPVVPSREEVLLNHRARSAKMRVAERVK